MIRKECPECHTLIDKGCIVCPVCDYDEECPCCILRDTEPVEEVHTYVYLY